MGAGGVIYLTPLVFNDLSFTASEIGSGLTAAALTGTITRLITGFYLDKGVKFSTPLKVAAMIAICADFLLLFARSYKGYVLGELFLGAAAGIYWPSIELAVPITCGKFQSSKGFALVRSADALGVSIGALIGAFAASINAIRMIYCVETLCMISFILLLGNEVFKQGSYINSDSKNLESEKNIFLRLKEFMVFTPKLIPILILSLLSTGILSLLQSALPIDLVLGGLNRPAISNSFIGVIIAIQLGLLLMIQWPIGNWLTKRNIHFGLRLSLLSFSIGCMMISLSSLYKEGLILAVLGLIPVSIGLASFLPTATEAIVQISPSNYRGITMAIYSQCFGLSALIAPWSSGIVIDKYGNGLLLWLVTSICCLTLLPVIDRVRPIEN